MGLATPAATAMQNLGLVRARLGVHREGLSIEERALAAFEAHGDRRMCAASHVYRAEILAMCDRLEEADAAATRGLEISIASPPIRVHALASASRIRLRRGEVSSARALAEEAAELLGTVSGIGEGESIVWLALVEARLAAGDRDAAREALSRGAADLRARAERISDPEHRRSFLGRVPENVALLALAEQPAVVQEG
jgi:hypothetical protein